MALVHTRPTIRFQVTETAPCPIMLKKLINKPGDVVIESLEGLALTYPDLLRVEYTPHYVARIDAPVMGKVTIISGSGSGHEPLNMGYVGKGMLDAACPGGVFTSPTPDQYMAAAHSVYGGVGVLFIMKNFSGGVFNMGMAIEQAREEGIEVESVLVNDDVAVERPTNRRGLGATILVEKLAGAAAEQGRSLREVADVARLANAESRSMGAALTSCTLPAVGRPVFTLPAGEFELGVGMHGERGRRRMVYTGADELTELLVMPILDDLKLVAGDKVLALVSGLGSTPQQELYIVYRHLQHLLADHDIEVTRRLVGNYITSLDTAGCAITLMRLSPEFQALWDAPVATPALCW